MSRDSMWQTRRTWMQTTAAGIALLRIGTSRAQSAASQRPALPTPNSLADALAAALRAHQPLVVLISLEGCPFCRIARENYLMPMHRREGLPVVQLDMRSTQAVHDFQQVDTTHDALIRAWGIKVAPTVMFFGTKGQEVAERLKGTYISDFYGAYLDQRLEEARQRIG